MVTRRWHRHLHHSVRHSLRHSLRWRLLALFLLLALAMSAAFVGGMKQAFSNGWRDAVLPLLSDYVDKLATDIGTPPDVARSQALVARLPISIRIDGPTVTFDSHPQRRDHYASTRTEADVFVNRRQGDASIARLVQRTTADGHRITFGLGDLDWHRGPGRAGLLTLVALLVLIWLAYVYVRRLFKPLEDIAAGARRFGVGDFGQAIPVRRNDELGDLAAQINTMGGDIHQMLEAKRALLLAISHELRSPLTRARLNTELLPEGPATGDMRAALLRDLTEMARLIEDLLESERLASPHAALNLEPVDLGELVTQVAAPFANQPGTTLVLSLAQGLKPMQLDRMRIRLLLRNLLDNAVVHSKRDAASEVPVNAQAEAVRIEVSLTETHGVVTLAVRDHGPGVSDDQLTRLSDAFYRTDSARGRTTGGVGLGLYLCRLIAKAHGGQLSLRNAQPGFAASVTLPS
jgi:signal transduction histidine kinase